MREPGERRKERQKVTKKPGWRVEEEEENKSLEAESRVNKKVEGGKEVKRVCV